MPVTINISFGRPSRFDVTVSPTVAHVTVGDEITWTATAGASLLIVFEDVSAVGATEIRPPDPKAPNVVKATAQARGSFSYKLIIFEPEVGNVGIFGSPTIIIQ
jgi:hypothetical protein